MTFPPIFAELRKRPGMYLPAVTYEAAVSFVAGYDAALNGGLLWAFHEWLVTQVREGANRSWPALVRELIERSRRQSGPGEGSHTTDDHEAAIDGLLSTIETFLHERSQVDGARRIFVAYERWLQEQEWYGPSSPIWIPPNT
jgi:hypothetical protein